MKECINRVETDENKIKCYFDDIMITCLELKHSFDKNKYKVKGVVFLGYETNPRTISSILVDQGQWS